MRSSRTVAFGTAVAAVAALAGCSGASSGASTPAAAGASSKPAGSPAPAPSRLRPSILPWQLAAPISREVVLSSGGQLLVAGGLTSGSHSAAGIYRIDPTSGAATHIGDLALAGHDAAGAVLAGQGFVFGGGAATSTSAVQAFPLTGGTASTVAHLPQPRSDDSVAVVAGTAYVIGGYTGTTWLPEVLATTDGRQLHNVARLAVPVRYGAVVPDGKRVLVIGGEQANGSPTDAIQLIDPAKASARVVGRLPHPLAHASGIVLGGRLLVAGGRTAGNAVTGEVWQIDPSHYTASVVAQLAQPVSDAGTAVIGSTAYLVGGEAASSLPVSTVQTLQLDPPGDSSAAAPFTGQLLIADRGNNRLLLVTADRRIRWQYPHPGTPPVPGGFYFPDDAFFIRHGTGVISNEEGNNAIVELSYPAGTLTWSYGHPTVAGRAPGYLNQPDDAFLLRGGDVIVADAKNCRILWISPAGQPVRQVGDGSCVHNPPRSLGYPNGDTPLADGDVLVSEIFGSWITDLTPQGGLRWTVHLPIAYPSDPQQIGPDRYLVADYTKPGGILEFDHTGRILWSYRPTSGPGMLNHPSLAELLPSGLIATNDDYRDRVVIIDPASKRIVWEYGVDDHPGTAPGLLNTPDGFDLLAPDRTTPTHPWTG